MLSPAMFDSIFDIETFLCPAAMSYQGLPGATRSPQEPRRATRSQQDSPRATRNHQGHQQPPGATGATRSATRSHLEQLEATRSHQDLPKSHQEPPGLSRHSSTRSYFHKNLSKACGPWAKTAVKLHVLPSPRLKLQ